MCLCLEGDGILFLLLLTTVAPIEPFSLVHINHVFLRFGHLSLFLRLCLCIDPSLNAKHLNVAGCHGISTELSVGRPDVKNHVTGDL